MKRIFCTNTLFIPLFVRINAVLKKRKRGGKKKRLVDFYNFVIYEGGKNSKRCFSRVRKFSKPRRRESRYTSHTSSRSIYVVDMFFYCSAGEIETNVARNEGISPTQRRRRQWLGGSCRSSNVQPPTLDALLLRRRWSIQARPITISTKRDRGSESSLLPCNSGRLEPRRRRRRCRSRCYIRGISRCRTSGGERDGRRVATKSYREGKRLKGDEGGM